MIHGYIYYTLYDHYVLGAMVLLRFLGGVMRQKDSLRLLPCEPKMNSEVG